MKTQNVIAIGISLMGISLVWIYAGWQVALGAFLMLWANNIQTSRE